MITVQINHVGTATAAKTAPTVPTAKTAPTVPTATTATTATIAKTATAATTATTATIATTATTATAATAATTATTATTAPTATAATTAKTATGESEMKEKWIVLFEGSVDKTFDTLTEAETHADELIKSCSDDEWDSCVEDIEIAKIIMKSTQVNLKKRPPESDLDDGNYDSEGTDWGNHEHQCDYKMKPILMGE